MLIYSKYNLELTKLASLPEAHYTTFLSALASAPYFPDAKALSEYILSSIKTGKADDLDKIVLMIDDFYHIREFSGFNADRFAEDLFEDIDRIDTLDEGDKPLVRRRIENLLNLPALKVFSKADRLQRDGERVFCKSKILSDIRPVFGEDPNAKPIGAVVSHTLKFTYHGDSHNEFRLVLDAQDLQSLKEVVERALLKDQNLRGLINALEIPAMGV